MNLKSCLQTSFNCLIGLYYVADQIDLISFIFTVGVYIT